MKTKKTKLAQIREFAARNNWAEALRIAAKFHDLGIHKLEITRAWAALQNPRFYEEIGCNPEQLIDAGIVALKTRYDL